MGLCSNLGSRQQLDHAQGSKLHVQEHDQPTPKIIDSRTTIACLELCVALNAEQVALGDVVHHRGVYEDCDAQQQAMDFRSRPYSDHVEPH